ncbi:hypothetical protein [Opitutus terrae]|uniref:Uncharacterized protein n=1 Tax=Opitutus terrae (strain DSM 11246 / JCM 15787 / PB90-1) TaxID=452637 RepID=B1ZSH4_OPITP|nr:hypothetical protein [Opitutus terrae]ACB73831.1 hypothetical protein Oter_0541 [Opitutus terrae PB90-1]
MAEGDSEWETLVWGLENILAEYGISVAVHGAFEEAALTLTELEEFRKNPMACDCSADPREKWRRAMSLADLAEKVLLARTHSDFGALIPHLRLLGGLADLSQFSTTLKENQDNNKVFELYVAAMALHALTQCTVDHPEESDGTNPDVMGRFNGRTWAIACKAMHSTNPKTFCERVREGVDQIEASAAERGLVVVNMKNTFDHDALWPAKIIDGNYHLGGLRSVAHARELLLPIYQTLQAGVFEVYGSERSFYEHLFKGKKAASYVLLIFSTVCGFPGPAFMPVKTINCLCHGHDAEAEQLAEQLNMALHNKPHDPVVHGEEQPG